MKITKKISPEDFVNRRLTKVGEMPDGDAIYLITEKSVNKIKQQLRVLKTYAAGCSFNLEKGEGAITVIDSDRSYRMFQAFDSLLEYNITRGFLEELGVEIIEEIE